MLISITKIHFVHIGKTKEINEILRAHNSGIGYQPLQPVHI